MASIMSESEALSYLNDIGQRPWSLYRTGVRHQDGAWPTGGDRLPVSGRRSCVRSVRAVRRRQRAGVRVRHPVRERGKQPVPVASTLSSSSKSTDSADASSTSATPSVYSCAGLAIAIGLSFTSLSCQVVDCYLRAIGRCATCAMGMMGMFKWLRKDIIQRERNGWNLSPKQCSLNNESYRNALQAFIDRRRFSDDTSVDTASQSSPEKKAPDYFSKNTNSRNNNNNNRNDKEWKTRGCKAVVPGIPHVLASEIFEIGWVAGTEDRYLELIFAEWQNTRVSLKRHTHPECRDALREDLEVLTEIRHPNILLLMGTTQTEDHGLVSIFESIDCTLYSYIHDQGERISIQGIAKSGGKLADALRHSHMRGYVHGAISSHCVYLASSGTIKLGGWELAVPIKSPNREREYEERLRSEIYQWLAPEIFNGCEPRKESDVYGLALLIWEMCTTHVPWSGLSKSDVEKQYSFWKRGVLMTDLYDFPPLVNNVLEAGLQLDVNKRTLDMNRMRRFLRRLEMQYEDEDAIYVDQFANNNNNETANTYVISTERSHTTTSGITGSNMPKQLFAAAAADVSRGPKSDSNLQRVNVFNDSGSENSKSNTASRQHKSTSALSNVHAHNEVNCSVVKQTTNNVLHPWNSTYRKVKLSKEILEAQQISIIPAANNLADTSDAENAQAMIKRLKELTARRRERFFYGTDVPKQSTHTSPPKTSPRAKNKVLIQARSKDYEPHKPASHKTSLEPKFCKSPGEYDPSTFTKFPCSQCRGPFCTSTSSGVKTGSIIPQVLNSDKDFFESSLWRKEKLICISKMRKPGQEGEMTGEESQGQINLEASKTACPRFESTRSDATYVINGKSSADTTRTTNSGHASHTIETETTFGSKETSNTENEPLQVLKDALDRATEIICSTEEMSVAPSTKFFDTFDQTTDSETHKSIFEEIYDLKSKDDEEIKTIERSDTDKHTFLLSPKSSNANESSKRQNSTYNSEAHEKSEQSLPEAGRSRNFVCESIAEISNESNASQEKIDDACAAISDYFTRKNEEASCFKGRNDAIQDSNEISLGSRDSNGGNYPFILLNDQSRDKGCRSCYKHALPRRRSLPAALGHLKGINHSALGKLPIRKGGIPDNTVEDLYIDDEFGDSLNVNMVLHDDDVSLDEDFLPETSEF